MNLPGSGINCHTLLWLHFLAQKNITISRGYSLRIGIVMILPTLFVTLALRLSV